MSKFSRDELLEMIAEYHDQKLSIKEITQKHGISSSTLRQHLKRYEQDGVGSIGVGKAGQVYGRYTGDFKLSVVQEHLTGNTGYRELGRKYGINHVVIMKWERVYLEEGEQGLLEGHLRDHVKESSQKRKGRPPKSLNRQVKQDLITEVQQLRLENAYLKKLNALVQGAEKSPQQKK